MPTNATKRSRRYEFQCRDVRREHVHGLLSRHHEGDEPPPYVRVWYLPPNASTVVQKELSEEAKVNGWTSQPETVHTGGLIIVGFTGSTTQSDWKDDLVRDLWYHIFYPRETDCVNPQRAFTQVSGSFLHPDLEEINTHHGFADWLNRRLDAPVKLETPSTDPFTPQSTDQKVENTVFNATLSAIGDLRRSNKYEGSGTLKMIVTGHSLVHSISWLESSLFV